MKNLCILLVLSLALLLTGCATQDVAEVKNEVYVGETVAVRGVVSSSIKLGTLSGYLLVDARNDSIAVSSSTLPEEGETLTVRGTLMKDTLFGYYIKK
jgi:hypothetical protein